MAVNLTINGVAYPFPVQGDNPPWGTQVTAWAQAVTAGMLQKAGGTFTLTSDADFGASYGLKAAKFSTRSASPAESGLVRAANDEAGISWRNAANDSDLALAVNASDQLTFNGVPIEGAASYTNDRAIVSNGSGQLSVSSTTATEIGYVSGVTSSIQNQINDRVPYTGATGNVDLGANDLGAANLIASGQISSGARDTMVINGGAVTSNIQANSDTMAVIESHTHSNTAGNGAICYHARSRGTTASPAIVQNGDILGIIAAVGYDGTDYAIGGWITWQVDGEPGTDDMPVAMVFATTPDGADSPVERMRITPAGAVGVAGLTASRALVTNASKELASSSVTDTELGYVSGVTGAIQTQLNAKLPVADPSATGTMSVTGNSANGSLLVTQSTAGQVVQRIDSIHADGNPEELVYQNTVENNGGPHVLITIPVPQDASILIKSISIVRVLSGGAVNLSAAYVVTAVARNVGGTVTIRGTPEELEIGDGGVFTPSISVSGTNVIISATLGTTSSRNVRTTARVYPCG